MSRKAVEGVLHNFLETYTSRYSDYDGYWLFGMLTDEMGQLNINLLNTACETSEVTPMTFAARLAVTKFEEQMKKAGLSLSCLREARLVATKSHDLVNGYVNGHPCVGFNVRFVVTAVSPQGKIYERKKSFFVAPHDPNMELRSTRRA
jgi:hypothetical protein